MEYVALWSAGSPTLGIDESLKRKQRTSLDVPFFELSPAETYFLLPCVTQSVLAISKISVSFVTNQRPKVIIILNIFMNKIPKYVFVI